jgi:predicted DCC family thiol-disulfide oxidoreductase YuxK
MTESPRKPTVIYDGTCGICAGNLKWLYRLDTLKKFDAIPYQTEDLLVRFPHLEMEECEKAMHLVFPDGRTYTGSDGFREVFLRMPLMFLIGLIMSVPDTLDLAHTVPCAGAQSLQSWRQLRAPHDC